MTLKQTNILERLAAAYLYYTLDRKWVRTQWYYLTHDKAYVLNAEDAKILMELKGKYLPHSTRVPRCKSLTKL